MQNDECRMQNEGNQMQNDECRMQNEEKRIYPDAPLSRHGSQGGAVIGIRDTEFSSFCILPSSFCISRTEF
jgi:hypothetical protein